ncbi:hypothetical protein [Streptomyces yokosukanensis]|uniref:hypothetical protein n=1 Tax=Streptomyces yokosukanensis TaxID=67386 RepID=UPI00131B64FD|nr:hypothetical protein [Streptomyces yokosukanensis]
MSCLIAIGASTALAACSSSGGPTSGEAGAHMSKDAMWLLDSMQKSLKAPERYTVTDDGSTDRKCGSGKQKRTFAAHMKVPASPNAHNALVLDSGDASGLLGARGYKLDTGAGQVRKSDNKYVEAMTNEKAHTHITVTLMAHGAPTLDYVLMGTTDCL